MVVSKDILIDCVKSKLLQSTEEKYVRMDASLGRYNQSYLSNFKIK